MLVRILTSLGRTSTPPPQADRSLQFRPVLEEFEDRLVLALYLWMPDTDLNWLTKANWWKWDNTAGDYISQAQFIPGGGDHVTFHGTWNGGAGNKDCVMNLARTVESITVSGSYSKTITLQKTLDIEGADAKLSGIFLSEGAATLRGSPGVATINMLGNSTFGWGAGNLVDLTINVSRADGKVATANVLGPGTTNHAMFGTVFHIDGQLNWKSGNVDALQTGAASGINISSAGEFNIGVAGMGWSNGYWGVGADQSKYFQVQNSGTVTVNAGVGTATLRGDYTTTGLTRLFAGTLDLAGAIARQTAGVFSVHDDSTVKVSGPDQALRIHDGSIIGDGKVDGNLTLGYDPAVGPVPQTTAVINPGFTTLDETGIIYTPGTITVTQAFEMFTSGAVMQIDVTASGGYDKVAVSFWARLSGALRLNPSPDYKPVSGTRRDFLTSASIVNDFAEKTSTYWGSWVEPGSNPVKAVKWTLPPPTGTTYSLVAELIVGSGPPGGGGGGGSGG